MHLTNFSVIEIACVKRILHKFAIYGKYYFLKNTFYIYTFIRIIVWKQNIISCFSDSKRNEYIILHVVNTICSCSKILWYKIVSCCLGNFCRFLKHYKNKLSENYKISDFWNSSFLYIYEVWSKSTVNDIS